LKQKWRWTAIVAIQRQIIGQAVGLMRRTQPFDLFLEFEFFFLHLAQSKLIECWLALCDFDLLAKVLMFIAKHLQVRTQAHGQSPR